MAIKEIAERLKDRFDFYIVTSRFRRDLPQREMRPEGTVIRLGFGMPLDKWLLPILGPLYYRGSASIVLGVDIGQGSLAAAVLKCLKPNTRFIFNIQYGGSEKDLSRGYLGLHGLLLRFMLSRADYVTAISKYLLDLSGKYGYRGTGEVIHNGVDIQKFQNPKSKIQKQKIIITTSRLVPKNGIDALIKAVAEVKKTIPDIQCWIIGDGPERKSLELQANAKFLGEIPHEKIPEYLHQADIFVRPSRSEGMGISFVEALAAGLPIIGTRVGGIADIIQEGKTGLFAKVDDPQDLAKKIIRILREPKLFNLIAEEGRKMVEDKFSWDGIAASYERLFQNVQHRVLNMLITTGLFPPEIGGPATYSKTLLEELPKSGIKVGVLPFSKVRHFPKIVRHLVYFYKILCRGAKADIIFAQDPVSVGVPSAMAASILRKKFIMKVVGDYAWEQGVQRFGVKETLDDFLGRHYGWQVELFRRLQEFSAKKADLVIVPSAYLKNVLTRWGIDPDKIRVVYNSFEHTEGEVSKAEARKRLGIKGTVFISAGRLVPWKGFETLIEVMPQILQNIADARLIIIGSGPLHDNLKKKIGVLHLESHAELKGQIPHLEFLRYLGAGDVFVLNTAYEGFSHTLLEAMAEGIPVITTNAGGNKEIVADGVTGVLVGHDSKEELKHAMVKLAMDQELRKRLVENARKSLGRFTKRKMVEETAKILKTL